MLKLCRVEEVRRAEEAAVAAGRSLEDLMAAAGLSVAEQITKRAKHAGTALFLVGPGNNGGDGLVAASHLVARGWRCLVWTWRRSEPGTLPAERGLLERLLWIDPAEVGTAIASADLIVDAVFGIGGKPSLPGEVAQVFDMARDTRARRGTPLVAVDTPSGVDCDSGEADPRAFRADLTVMLGLPKIGLYKPPALRHTGVIELADIGLPAPPAEPGSTVLATPEDVREWLPRRPADTHKRAVGTLLIVGGSPAFYGAPRLAAGAALRAGAGLVTLAVTRALISPIAAALPEVTFLPLPDGEVGAGVRMAELVREALPRYDVVLIGPGLGQEPPVPEFLAALLGLRGAPRPIGFGQPAAPGLPQRFGGRAVIDADGLNWLATQPEWWNQIPGADLILTPHPGELARLLNIETDAITADPWARAVEAAQLFNQHVVLKYGHATVACPDGTLIVSPQVHPALATAGTGDVLAGLIAALASQGLGSREAAAAGLVIGSEAMLRAVAKKGTLGLVAGDLIEEIAGALAEVYDASW
ncbi:NAD(P)H-hydrate dehydratase [Thermomicrobiaceae bacterium CFH 74404]|uniref:Bifunctional NAD(P)H-hydrate repair enzyme n=1 Tax=Thermalbibacter longus TaxID=2951981 RepID=A0AA42BE41_9BACT|nr:NAD(P)H-hydrate dehydratase [Thermalbibacter longus]MCM8750393.1 NAD(P)H-hydrate dehydratase [Thermalbibacter longus]